MVNSPLNNAQLESLLSRTKGLLRQAGLQAKKGLGQHFLVDGAFLKYILTAAELTNDDVVIEVGPGLGVLTVELAERVRLVVAIEKDDNLAALLAKTMKSNPNVLVINEDILRVEPAILLRERLPAGDQSRYKVVANLPYYITSPVLRLFLEASFKPQIMVVMVQKEVARQITAKPGDMSLLSIAIQLYGLPKIVKYVPARAFYPAPDVDSAILKINIYARPVVDVEPSSFFTLVRAGFSAARKQLVNSISHRLGLPKTDTMTLLQAAGIDPTRRAETLSLEEWGRLWRKYTEVKKNDR